MKSWFDSRLPALLLVLVSVPVLASDASEGLACLDRYDLGCAQKALGEASSGDQTTWLKARLAFSLGDFAEAADTLGTLESSFGKDPHFQEDLTLYRSTANATLGFKTETRGDITLRYLPGEDTVMADETFETLAAARDRIGARLGGAPPDGIRMELYPTISRFIDASSLPASAVRTTGVIALSKWTRLLVTSPRALGKGYAWKDTISHEYTHYIVAWRTHDKAPVWLQEGIARAHELYWREDGRFELAPYSQGLLAEALKTDNFVPLAKMHPSIAFLPSAEEASLAYAQVSTMIVYLQKVAGPTSVSQVLDKVRDGVSAEQAVADVGAAGDMDAFLAGWKQMLAGMNLIQRKLESAPTGVDPGQSGYDLDPVLAERKDLANFARLGDLLAEHGHFDAAMVEYRKAVPANEPPSPMLSESMAKALLKLGKGEQARQLLQTSVTDYPEYAFTHAFLARLYLADGKRNDALTQFRFAADIDPFDPEVQGALADLYAATGQKALADRHAGYKRILEAGGLPAESK